MPSLKPATIITPLTAATSHPDRRAVLIQIVALHCLLCALAGEAIRERLHLPLTWTVRVENSLGTSGKDLHAADLMAVDGRICQVSIPLIRQIADPDHSPPSRILRTFVDFQVRYPFLG